MGMPGEFEKPEVQKVISHYEDICRKMKKPMGFHIVQPDREKLLQYSKVGYSFLAVGVDILYLGVKCKEVIGQRHGFTS